MSSKKETISNIYNIIFKRNKKVLIKFFLVSTPGCLAAFFEGITFALLLSSLYILNGRGIEVFQGKPILKHLATIPFLQELSANALFIIMVLAAIAAQIIKSLIFYYSSMKAAKLNAKISCELHENIYEHILSFDFATVSNYKAGGLASYTQIPSTSLIPILDSLHKSVVNSIVLLVLLAVLFKISLPLTLFFSAFFFLAGVAYKKILNVIRKYSEECANKLLLYNNDVVQAINGIKLIHIFGMQKVILNRSRAVMEKMQEHHTGRASLQALLTAAGEVFSMMMMGATIGISSLFLVINNEHSLPLLLTYTVTAYRFTTVAREVIAHIGQIAAQSGSAIKLNEILTKKDKGFEPTGGKPAPSVKKAIELRGISFKYPSKETWVLKNISLTIPHKKMTAIVGLSGSGKTTLISLLTRLFDPTHGKILIDGVDLHNYNITSWRSKLGVVSQNTVIFNDPARENICFGTPASDDEILQSCKIAGCYNVIQSLPKGLDSPLGDHGYKISGGEAQRIAIARALIRNPEVMIFDEATSNLDSHNEQIIQKALEECRNQNGLIVIAHRLSTVTSADQIIVMKHGEIVETGAHEELLSEDGEYAYLWKLQSNNSLEQTLV